MIAYAILMLPTALRKPRHWKFIGVFFISYSGGIELVQPYVNRYGEYRGIGLRFYFRQGDYFLISDTKTFRFLIP